MSAINQHPIVISDLPNTDHRLTVMWYCGLKRNDLAPSEQKIVVCFRPSGMFTNVTKLQFHEVGVTHIGQLKIGSVWQNQKLVDESTYDEKLFEVNGDENDWQVVNAWSPISSTDKDWLIPASAYNLRDKENCAQTKVIKFSIDGNSNSLVIPCIEIFSKMYGRSHHLKKTLINNPLKLAIPRLLYPDVQPEIPNGWLVTVTRDCLNDDAVYLAHLKHDKIAYERTDRIWHSLQKSFVDSFRQFAFPVIPPWFSGKVKLKVKGLWLNNEKTRFLGLQILGCSDPMGPDIYLDRENTNLSEIKKKEGGTAYLYKRKKTLLDEIRLTSSDEPGRNQEAFQVFNDPIEIIGDQREITRVIRTEKETGEIRILKNETEISHYSAGDQYGSKLHVQSASLETPQKVVPTMFIKIWNSLQTMVVEQKIISVSSIDTAGTVIGLNDMPGLIELPIQGLSRKSKNEREAINWLYKGLHGTIPRQLLLAHLRTSNGDCYLLEIERRIVRTSEESDSFKGLVVRSDHNSNFINQLGGLLIEIVKAKGVIDKCISGYSGMATFKHVPDEDGGMERAILNGLKKVGLY
jgi:hypothetical protein